MQKSNQTKRRDPFLGTMTLLGGFGLWALLALVGSPHAQAEQLRVTSSPSGAVLLVNGIRRGKTPFSGELSAGRYHIELRRNGFLTWTSYIQLPQRSDLSLRARLEKRSSKGGTANTQDSSDSSTNDSDQGSNNRGGLVIVNSVPSGASVYKGSSFLGQTPLLRFLPLGEHTLSIQQSGYKTATREVRVRSNKSVRLKVKLTAGSGATVRPKNDQVSNTQGGSTQLMILSEPSAKVYLGGRYLGMTPVLSAGISPGSYQLVLKRKGYLPYRRSMQLVSGQQRRIRVTLVRQR